VQGMVYVPLPRIKINFKEIIFRGKGICSKTMYFCLKQKNEFGKYFFRETLFILEMRWYEVPLPSPILFERIK
jgi:hypothetical protein